MFIKTYLYEHKSPPHYDSMAIASQHFTAHIYLVILQHNSPRDVIPFYSNTLPHEHI